MESAIHIRPPPKPKLCVWADLNVHNMDRISHCLSESELRNLVQNLFSVDDSPRGQVLLDLYMHAIKFALAQKFTSQQSSAFFSIVKQTHEVCVSTPFGNVDECFAYFRELVLTHAVHRPPWSLEIFNCHQVEAITNYVVNNYFRHYKLYKYTFTPKVRLDLSLQYDGLAPSPPPEPDVPEEHQVEPGEGEEEIAQHEELAPDTETDALQQPEELVGEHAEELESIIRQAVSMQLKQMHASVEKQLEDTDKAINEKISVLEQGAPGTPKGRNGRSARSGKGKRK